jgi:hypothetical protein
MPKVPTLEGYFEEFKSFDVLRVHTAVKDEATRQVQSMLRWKQLQEDLDVDDMLWLYETDVFPIIDKAVKLRRQIYDKNKEVKKALQEMGIAFKASQQIPEGDEKEQLRKQWAEAHSEWLELQDEQVMVSWKIMRCYCAAMAAIKTATGQDETENVKRNPFDVKG